MRQAFCASSGQWLAVQVLAQYAAILHGSDGGRSSHIHTGDESCCLHSQLCCRWLDHTIWKIISVGGATGGEVREQYKATSGLISRPVEQMEELILA